MRIIPNFLEKNKFLQLQKIVFSSDMPFYYNNKIVGNEKETEQNDFMFTHGFYDDNKQQSDYFNLVVMPLLGRLNLNFLIRAKLNCYTKKNKLIYSKLHTDFLIPHSVALFSFNTCNGFTYFEDSKDEVKSIENQMIIYDGNRKHCSVAQTDTNLRINLNINFT